MLFYIPKPTPAATEASLCRIGHLEPPADHQSTPPTAEFLISVSYLFFPHMKKEKEGAMEKPSEHMAELTIVEFSKEDQDKKEEVDESWSCLPPELLHLVSAHLFVGDFTTFRAICKSWRSSSPISRPLPSLLDSPHSESPCLISLDDHKFRIFHPIYNGTYQMEIPEYLMGARIRYSKYGWLLLSRNDGSNLFFHPFSKLKIEIPSYPPGCDTHAMCFSSPPTSKDCVVIGIMFSGTTFLIIRRGEVAWTECRLSKPSFVLSTWNPILYKGRCYCLGTFGELAAFDPYKYLEAHDPNQYLTRWTSYSTLLPRVLQLFVESSYMMESNGKLIAVFEAHDYEPCIHVYSLNLLAMVPQKKWQQVRNLGNKMIYVSPGGSFSESAVVKGMNNKIYLPNVRDSRNVFYSLKTNKYHSFFSDYSTRFSSHGREFSNCAWIKPMSTTLDQGFKW